MTTTEKPLLTVGMPTWREAGGAYYTIQGLIVQLKSLVDAGVVELLVVDNCPHSDDSEYLRGYLKLVPRVRYVEAMGASCAALAKEQVIRHASADTVVCIDAHVTFEEVYDHPVLAAHRFFEDPANHDVLLHGPLLGYDLVPRATHMERGLSGAMFGLWRMDERGYDRDGEAFEIDYMGTGCFALRKDRWPGMHRGLRGVCAEEGYLHDKWRKCGGRVMCLPAFRWIHRPQLPEGNRYVFRDEDVLRNYLLQHAELGQDPQWVLDHFEARIGREAVLQVVSRMSTIPPRVAG